MWTTDESLLRLITQIEPASGEWLRSAVTYQDQLTKPPGSLGRLEELGNRMCAIRRTLQPTVHRPRLLVFAADHGVCLEGVNAYPQAVTAQMVTNFIAGGAAINAIGRACQVELCVIDVGVATPIPDRPSRGEVMFLRRAVAHGTRNFCREPAMNRRQALAALSTGATCATEAIERGSTVLCVGEMGIGNTTAAAALCSAITGLPAQAVCGRGAGADDAVLARKLAAVERAVALHAGHARDPVDLLARLGGFEIAAITGVCLAAAGNRCAVVVDGVIATAGGVLAARLAPCVRDYLFASHRSTEPAHAPLLKQLETTALFDFQMRLGEGTGAALAVPILRAATEVFHSMATFAAAGVSGPVAAGPV